MKASMYITYLFKQAINLLGTIFPLLKKNEIYIWIEKKKELKWKDESESIGEETNREFSGC